MVCSRSVLASVTDSTVLVRTSQPPVTTSTQRSHNMFTYDPTLADTISQVRFFIGDTIERNGPRANNIGPEKTNFVDEEITAILALESGSVVDCVAVLLDTLANEWSKLATSITIGPRKEELYRVVDAYRKQADDWRSTNGLAGRAFSSGVIRRDPNANSELTA